MTQEKITVRATVLANKQKVWDFYTQPEHITKWNFADPSWHCPIATNDMTIGGRYVARMEAKDGSFGFDFEGIYNEIVHGEKFTFTMPDSRVVNVIFNGLEDKTDVTIILMQKTKIPLKCNNKDGNQFLTTSKNIWKLTKQRNKNWY